MIPQRNLSLLSNRLARAGGRRVVEAVLERDYCLAWFLVGWACPHQRPAVSNTIDGVMEESIRFPGAMALRSLCTRPYAFGDPAFDVKSSISLLRRNPAPVTTTPHPCRPFSVVVSATAFPAASTTPSVRGLRRLRRQLRPAGHCVRRRGRVRIDRRAERGEIPVRDERRQWDGDEVRISEQRIPVSERAPHRLGREVEHAGRVPAHARDVVPLEDAQDHGERDAARGGRRHGRDPEAAIGEFDRSAPGAVALQVLVRDESASPLHFFHDEVRDLTLIEPVRPGVADQPQRCARGRAGATSCRRRRAVVHQELRAARGEAGQFVP